MTLVKRGGVAALLRQPDPRLRGAVVHGPDRAAVAEVGAGLLARLTPFPDDPFTVSLLSDADLDAEQLATALAARSLTGDRRIVHLRLAGDLGAKERLLDEALRDHLDDAYGSDAFLLVECGALDKRSALRKTAESSDKVVGVALYEEESSDIGRLAREVLDTAGLSASSQVLTMLAQRLPRDRGGARQVIEALMLFVGPEKRHVESADVEAVLPVDAGGAASDVASAAFSGQVDRTVEALRRAHFLGDSGPALLRSLALHRSRLARAKASTEGGASPQAAVKSAGVFWKEERAVIDQMAAWRMRDLDAVQRLLTEADIDCKTGGSPDEVIAHHCAVAIALHTSRR